MRTSFLGFLCISFLSLLFASSVFAYVFPRDLSIGAVGEDVRELQKVLNADVRTQIAASGDGARGFETTYYGSLTANAVRRYQELYRDEILAPLGLFMGTGFFGAGTRGFMMAKGAVNSVTTTISGGATANSDDFQKAQESKYGSTGTIKDIIPTTEKELIDRFQEISGTKRVTDANVEEFARTMLFASQGLDYHLVMSERNQQGDDAGSFGDEFDGGSGSGSRSSNEYGDGGCIDILFGLLGL